MKAYRDSMLNVEKEKLNYARHGKAIRRLPLNVALADRQHRNIPRLRRQAREPFKTPRPQVKGKFVMPANAGIQVRFQFTIKNRLDSGFRRNDDNNSRLQSPNSESLGLVMIQQPGCMSKQLLRGREHSGEFISLSTWEDQASIDRYRASDAHKTLQQHTRAVMYDAKVEVKTYDLVQS